MVVEAEGDGREPGLMSPSPLESPLWDRELRVNYGGRSVRLPLRNFAGRNYPALIEEAMVALLGISPADRVLDVGGGDAAFTRADVVTDAFLDEDAHRSGRGIQAGKRVLQAFAEDLPFADREFDFAWSRQVFEHVADPARACAEIQRVARRGFIETPGLFGELLMSHPTHRWLISVEEGTLVFRPRPFRRAPLGVIGRALWYSDPDFQIAWELTFRNLVTVPFYWEEGFDCRVEPRSPDDFDYDDISQRAESHLDFALNGLLYGSVPAANLLVDAQEAVRLRPEWALAQNALGCLFWQEGRREEARDAFHRAVSLEPDHETYRSNASLNLSEKPRLVLFEDSPDQTMGRLSRWVEAIAGTEARATETARATEIARAVGRAGVPARHAQPPTCLFGPSPFAHSLERFMWQHPELRSRCEELLPGILSSSAPPAGVLPAQDQNMESDRDLNEDGRRWAEIYERVRLEEIPNHYRTFTAMPFLARYLEKALETCPEGGRVLETGIGFGYGAIWLSQRGRLAEGLDYEPAIVERGNRINRILGGSATFRFGDAFDLERYARGTYDLILHQGVLEHFSDEEIRAILGQQVKIARRVLFSVPSVHYPFEKEFGNERLLSLEQWQEILRGFDVELLTYYGDPGLGAREQIMGVLRGHPAYPARAGHGRQIVWNSPLFDPSGYADEARHFLWALDGAGYQVAARPIRWSDRAAVLADADEARLTAMTRRPAQKGSVNVCHLFPPHFTPDPDACLNVGRTMFETDRLPDGWAEACNRMDRIWVPSEFNRETFARAGVQERKLAVIPGLIDMTPYDPAIAPLRIDGARGFNFLSLFDWTLRKGWDVLIRAYVEEFAPDEDAALIIKTHSSMGYSIEQIVEAVAAFISGTLGRDPERIPDILFQGGNIPAPQMPALYRAADCFVLPTRGEGWGRPYMEAMAMGLPVIGTDWSGNTAFMNSLNSYLLGYKVVPVPESAWRETPTYRGHRWAEPDPVHLRRLMRQVFTDRQEAQAVGRRARAEITSRFTYAPVAALIGEEIAADPLRKAA
jgi:glycosyltransferase involved in cell wall biosynthesis